MFFLSWQFTIDIIKLCSIQMKTCHHMIKRTHCIISEQFFIISLKNPVSCKEEKQSWYYGSKTQTRQYYYIVILVPIRTGECLIITTTYAAIFLSNHKWKKSKSIFTLREGVQISKLSQHRGVIPQTPSLSYHITLINYKYYRYLLWCYFINSHNKAMKCNTL